MHIGTGAFMRQLARLACCFLLVACCQSSAPERRAAERFAEIRSRPAELAVFLRRMPKGGDLHNHLSGAIYAESFLAWAAKADSNLCLNLATWTFEPAPCDPDGRPPVAYAISSGETRARLINALSMRNYVPGQGTPSAHDQFFASFSRFSKAGDGHGGEMLKEVAVRAAAQNINYLELMISLHTDEVVKRGVQNGWMGDRDTTRTKFDALNLDDQIPKARESLDKMLSDQRTSLECDLPSAAPACAVKIRFIAQVIRTQSLPAVFAQAVFAFRMVHADPRIVGLNFVAPEDHPVALANYTKHMWLVHDLAKLIPKKTPVSLHAGELTLGLVPTEDLRRHISEAVTIAGARRIGHGVDIVYEDNADDLLSIMKQRDVMVEINLTSNDVILGVRGDRHPFPLYRRAGVPVALSTDDEGVSRIDLTHEFQRAAETYDLSYLDLKALARNSLNYSFLPGDGLWNDSRRFTLVPPCAGVPLGSRDLQQHKNCADYLDANEKARQQWQLESEFAAFEKSIVGPAGRS